MNMAESAEELYQKTMEDEQYQEILELVQETTGRQYTGKIEVRFDEPDM